MPFMIYTGHNLNLIFAEIPFFDQKPAIFEQKVTNIPDIPFHFGFYMQCMDYFQKILQKKNLDNDNDFNQKRVHAYWGRKEFENMKLKLLIILL